jgi:hypothetical protein
MKTSSFASRRRAGFTLVEIMYVTFISGLVVIALVTFLRLIFQMYVYDGARNQVNKDIRSFTGDLINKATYASSFCLFTDFKKASRTKTVASVDYDNIKNEEESGDMMVLVYTTTVPATGVKYVNRLVGFFRSPIAGGAGPVRRFDVSFTNFDARTSTHPYSYLLDTYVPETTETTYPVVIQLAQGLSDGQLFFNYYKTGVLVKGQIVENGLYYLGPGTTYVSRRAVNTYNFTVSPRS